MDVNMIDSLFLTGAVLIVLSVLLTRASSKLGVPILLIFLVVGMLAGEDGPGQIDFNDHSLTYLISNLALAVILLDGGMRTKVSSFKVAFWPSLSLATIGVALTSTFTGLMAAWLFDLTLLQGILVGAIVGSTDAAAVFSMLKGQSLNERVGSTLEIESGTNDPMAVFLTVTLIAVLGNPEADLGLSFLATSFGMQFGIGALVGLGGGWLLWALINRVDLHEGLYSVLVIAGGIALFALSNKLGGSGILSIYLAGLLIGNKPTSYRHSILNVLDGMTWMSQIVMFLVLGLLVKPATLIEIMIPALILAFGMILVARPLAVWIGLMPFKSFTNKERKFISWVGLRGAVPIILAVFPMVAGLPNAELYFNIAFFVVMVSLLVQGGTLMKAARMADVTLPPKPTPISRSGMEIFRASEWETFVYRLKEEKWCVGEPLKRLTMPEGTRITAVFRDEELLHPTGSTVLQANDTLCVMGQDKDLDALSLLFSEAPEDEVTPRFFGDFFLDINCSVSDVTGYYGITVLEEEADMPLKELVELKLGLYPVLGDSFDWYGLHWVVADVKDHKVMKIGLGLPDNDKADVE
ncbi:K+/H+ antiporter [Vibrio breoganii]|nr:potassium/proton antiporter [Vibrio breoganii]PML65251.1 K+/H+ antiporter [Vibrio breoganii]PMO81853.1 K+/H+ antiporter [Vibrio breoganii]